jgi:hypothetical protein
MDADVCNDLRIEDNEAFNERPASATYRNVSPPCPERHPHDNFTSPRQNTNLPHAGFRFFPRISDRVFKGGRPCEKRRRRRGCSSANLPTETKGLNFDYLWSHVVSTTKGDREYILPLLLVFPWKLLDTIRASAIVRTCSMDQLTCSFRPTVLVLCSGIAQSANLVVGNFHFG